MSIEPSLNTPPELDDFLRLYSVETTSGDRKSIEASGDLLAPGTEVFIASLPNDPPGRQATAAAELRRHGMRPVPHIVARNIKDARDLAAQLDRLTSTADIERVLLVAGDRDHPAGDYHCTSQIIATGLVQKAGIRRILLSWFPEGHPRVPDATLDSARAEKLKMAADAGLAVTLISQFCFESEPIIATAERIRREGVTAPLRIGVAGPAARTALLKYAMICGVGASLRALKERPGSRSLVAGETPQALLIDIARAQAANPILGFEGVHFFTFASLAATAKFVAEHRPHHRDAT